MGRAGGRDGHAQAARARRHPPGPHRVPPPRIVRLQGVPAPPRDRHPLLLRGHGRGRTLLRPDAGLAPGRIRALQALRDGLPAHRAVGRGRNGRRRPQDRDALVRHGRRRRLVLLSPRRGRGRQARAQGRVPAPDARLCRGRSRGPSPRVRGLPRPAPEFASPGRPGQGRAARPRRRAARPAGPRACASEANILWLYYAGPRGRPPLRRGQAQRRPSGRPGLRQGHGRLAVRIPRARRRGRGPASVHGAQGRADRPADGRPGGLASRARASRGPRGRGRRRRPCPSATPAATSSGSSKRGHNTHSTNYKYWWIGIESPN
ncbi:MAG: hypothetical protein MZV64_11430 [Ignavibacteriales bacterium]|nr:hypothetical protein [Ignavibacteriales bacterium]